MPGTIRDIQQIRQQNAEAQVEELVQLSELGVKQCQSVSDTLIMYTSIYYKSWKQELKSALLKQYLLNSDNNECPISGCITLSPVVLVLKAENDKQETSKSVFDADVINRQLFTQIPSIDSPRHSVDYRTFILDIIKTKKAESASGSLRTLEYIDIIIESYNMLLSTNDSLKPLICPATRREVLAVKPVILPDFIQQFSDAIEKDIKPGTKISEHDIAIVADFMDVFTNLDLKTMGIDVDSVCVYGQNLLYIACKYGLLDQVKKLIEFGANPNAIQDFAAGNDRKRSPLNIAASFGYANIVEFLLSLPGINVNQLISSGLNHGHSALWIAAYYGHAEVIAHLINAGADVNQCSGTNLSPLFVAMYKDHRAAVKVILEYGMPKGLIIDQQQGAHKFYQGVTALFFAAEIGLLVEVKLLLEYGADPSVPQGAGPREGQTALDIVRTSKEKAPQDFSGEELENAIRIYDQVIEALQTPVRRLSPARA